MPPWPLWPGCVPPMALAATGLSIHSAMHADSTAGDPDSAKAIATDVSRCAKDATRQVYAQLGFDVAAPPRAFVEWPDITAPDAATGGHCR